MKPERSGRAACAERVGGESRMGRLRDSALSGERADPLEAHCEGGASRHRPAHGLAPSTEKPTNNWQEVAKTGLVVFIRTLRKGQKGRARVTVEATEIKAGYESREPPSYPKVVDGSCRSGGAAPSSRAVWAAPPKLPHLAFRQPRALPPQLSLGSGVLPSHPHDEVQNN